MVNFFAPLNNLGMGRHAYGLIKAFEHLSSRRGYSGKPPEVAVFPPFGHDQINDAHTQAWIGNRIYSDVKEDPSIMIFDMQFFPHFAGNKRIGFAVFETTGFTPMQFMGLQSLDYILTPSEWAKEVLAKNGLKSFVVNEGFDPKEFSLYLKRSLEHKNRRFRFLHVGKLEERKGTLQAVRSFAREFNKESVELLLHCENPFLTDGGRGQVSNLLSEYDFKSIGWLAPGKPNRWKRGDQFVIWNDYHVDLMMRLYHSADCGIFPSKGEGWGLPILECIASGTPAICGNWTGMSEYINPHVYPEDLVIRHAGLKIAKDDIWFHGDRGDWFVLENHEVEKKMRWAFENARELVLSPEWKHSVMDYIRGFTWDHAAHQLDRVLDTINQSV